MAFPTEGGALHQKFIAPPFSIIDTLNVHWRKRVRTWNDATGIDGGSGRDSDLLGLSRLGGKGTSHFDPVLTEVLLQWYAPRPQNRTIVVLDPFAGGPTRGVVAAYMGFRYFGIDLRAEQVEANRAAAHACCKKCRFIPEWIVGDAQDTAGLFRAAFGEEALADIVLTCPPYYNLERYSDSPTDLSNAASYEAFLGALESCIASAVSVLRDRHAAIFVVGNVWHRHSRLLDLHSDTKRALARHRCALYVDAVLRTCLNTAPLRASRYMNSACKLVTVHQNVVISCKGDVFDKVFCAQVGIHPALPTLCTTDADTDTECTHAEPAPTPPTPSTPSTTPPARILPSTTTPSSPTAIELPIPPVLWRRHLAPATAATAATAAAAATGDASSRRASAGHEKAEAVAPHEATYASAEEWDAAATDSIAAALLRGESSRVQKPRRECFSNEAAFATARSWRACTNATHEGERILPLTSEYFNCSNGRFTHCRQCKLRYIQTLRAANAAKASTSCTSLPCSEAASPLHFGYSIV